MLHPTFLTSARPSDKVLTVLSFELVTCSWLLMLPSDVVMAFIAMSRSLTRQSFSLVRFVSFSHLLKEERKTAKGRICFLRRRSPSRMQNRYPCCDIGHTHAQHVKISQMMKGESQVENKQETRSLNAGGKTEANFGG